MQKILNRRISSSIKALSGLLLMALWVATITGCKKFLDVSDSSSSNVKPHTIVDFEDMMNNASLSTPDYVLYDMISDDAYLPDGQRTTGASSSVVANYLWAKDVFNSGEDDRMYNDSYSRINTLNIVIDNVMLARDGSVERKEMVLAQAKIHRAYYFFQLVNMYGAAYDAATASTDLGVPLTLHAAPEQFPHRATVDSVYTQVLNDLHDALATPSLPDFGVDIIHPGKAAAYGMMGRVYLYMNDYVNAKLYADSALNLNSQILDYEVFSFDFTTLSMLGPLTLLDKNQNDPEILFGKVCSDKTLFMSLLDFGPYGSDELMSYLDPTDYRRMFFFFENVMPSPKGSLFYVDLNSDNPMSYYDYSVTVPEMMLTKAECLARDGDKDGAMALVNELRKYRIMPAVYAELTATDADDALSQVLDERRRELFFHGGIRTFDLKRLNKEPQFAQDLQRTSDDGSVISTIAAGSPRYIMPFAPKITNNNPYMVPNER